MFHEQASAFSKYLKNRGMMVPHYITGYLPYDFCNSPIQIIGNQAGVIFLTKIKYLFFNSNKFRVSSTKALTV